MKRCHAILLQLKFPSGQIPKWFRRNFREKLYKEMIFFTDFFYKFYKKSQSTCIPEDSCLVFQMKSKFCGSAHSKPVVIFWHFSQLLHSCVLNLSCWITASSWSLLSPCLDRVRLAHIISNLELRILSSMLQYLLSSENFQTSAWKYLLYVQSKYFCVLAFLLLGDTYNYWN